MKALLLCCSRNCGDNLEQFNEIWCLGAVIQRQLASRGIKSENLFDIELPDIDHSVSRRIEEALAAEAKEAGDNCWAELAFQRVHWRFVQYYQYRLRIERLIIRQNIGCFFLSSKDDSDLMHACVAACDSKGVNLVLNGGQVDPPSSLLSFLSVFDIPNEVSTLDPVFLKILALYYRLRKVQIFFQPYNNLTPVEKGAFPFSWTRSVSFFSGALSRWVRPKEILSIGSQTATPQNLLARLDPAKWSDFDPYDLKVIASALGQFKNYYTNDHLSKMYKHLCEFFVCSEAQRIMLNSDTTFSSRLIAKAAKSSGLCVDYLPHGLIFEDCALRTDRIGGVERILAWSEASAKAFERRGCTVKVVSHPINHGLVTPKKPLAADLSSLRVLLLPPEWVGLSFAGRPDCFERDLLDILEALGQLHIKYVHVKFHNAPKIALANKRIMLTKLMRYAPVGFVAEVIDPSVKTRELYERFDLVIMGATTGLFEASRSCTPFIGFRAFIQKAGIFDGYSLPKADKSTELFNVICNYDTSLVDRQCIEFYSSLNIGPSPFTNALNNCM